MERIHLPLDSGTVCSAWNYCGLRLATGSTDGFLSIYDQSNSDSFHFRRCEPIKVDEDAIIKVVWLPPEYGDSVACICLSGKLSLLEEVVEGKRPLQWKLCKEFGSGAHVIINCQFGVSKSSLKMVIAHADCHVRVHELVDPLNLSKWRVQAEMENTTKEVVPSFKKVSCKGACISWKPWRADDESCSFVMGFNSDSPQYNSAKVWEYDAVRFRWSVVAELLSGEEEVAVHALAWAPNIGRPYERIAVATDKGILVWHVHEGAHAVSLFPSAAEVCQMEWDMSGMTLAVMGCRGELHLWQSNPHGVWHHHARFIPHT